jgi:secernin
MVAVGSAVVGGGALLAKNSDRPARECQPLVQVGAATHPHGSVVRCQYVEIPQVERTAAFIGSQPYWLWGLEHGLNEHGVAVGNHTVFTRDKPEGQKLIGMDLVRLGLERAASAAAAAEVITDLVELYGQGGSGYADSDFPYHSSFMIADRREAYLIETSDRHWARRRIGDIGGATNHVTINTDWDRLSDGAVEHARGNGWWEGEGRFDFAAAYRDLSWVPATFSSGRYRRTCDMLAERRGDLDAAIMRRSLRDHYGSPVFRPVYEEDDERFLSVCMHADPIGATTASMVADLPADRYGGPCYWGSLGAPCVGVFLPYYPEGVIPPGIKVGASAPRRDSPWWEFRRLHDLVERDFERFGPQVRQFWDDWEEQLSAAAAEVVEEAAKLRRRGDSNALRERLTSFMAANFSALSERLATITAAIES